MERPKIKNAFGKDTCFTCTKLGICIVQYTVNDLQNKVRFAKAHSKLFESLAENCQYYKEKEY